MEVTQKTLDHTRRQLVDRGFGDVTWVRPTTVETSVLMPTLETTAFLERWTADAAALLARYCELMGIDKRRPKLSAKKFHDRAQIYRKEMADIQQRVDKGLLSEAEADEVHDLRERIVWAHYRELADQESGGDIPETYLAAPAGFFVGHLITRKDVIAREWELDNRGTAFSGDFRVWLAVVHG